MLENKSRCFFCVFTLCSEKNNVEPIT